MHRDVLKLSRKIRHYKLYTYVGFVFGEIPGVGSMEHWINNYYWEITAIFGFDVHEIP